jgi:hypothetical protein
MTIVEMIKNRVQELLGDSYIVHENESFNRRYTNPVQTAYGERYDINHQAFEENIDKIIATVTVNEPVQYNTPYKIFQGNYTIAFWVPIDTVKLSSAGMPIQAPKFTFFADVAALKASIESTYTYNDEDTALRAYFTMGEPALLSSTLDKTGCYDRIVYQVTGQIAVADENLTTGEDISIAFVVDEEEHSLSNPTNLIISSNTESSTIIRQTDIKPKQSEAALGYSISFTIDDLCDADNQAYQIIENKIFEGADTGKVLVRLYKKGTLRKEFRAVLNIDYGASGKAGYGKYTVYLLDDGGEDDA